MAFGFDADWLAQRQQAVRTAQAAPRSTTEQSKTKTTKYRNRPVLVDLGPSGERVGGKLRLVHTFDSQREADYYQELKIRRAAGEIEDLDLQYAYALIAHAKCGPAQIIGYYEADFVFFELKPERRMRVIDVKGMKTQVYALKKKIVEACWGITIEEV